MPVIAISAVLSEAELDTAKQLGAVEVLHKPITPEWKPVVERIRAVRHP
jgi:CheY-like chemotaxis protein